MDNGLAFVEKNAMCTGVFMYNLFVFAENLQGRLVCERYG